MTVFCTFVLSGRGLGWNGDMKNNHWKLAVWLVLLWLSLGARLAWAQMPPGMQETQVPAQAFVRGAPLPVWFKVEERLPVSSGTEPILTRLSQTHFRVDDGPRVVVQRAMQAKESGALPEIGQYPIIFHPDFQTIELHTLRVHRQGAVLDRLAGAGVRFLHSEHSAEQGIYTGSVTAVVVVADVRPDDTLEIIYSLVGANPVMGKRFVDAAGWDQVTPTLLRRVILDVPMARKVAYQILGESGGRSIVPTRREVAGRQVTVFEGKDLPGIPAEPLVPPDAEPYRWIQFSEFENWGEVVLWAQGLFTLPAGAAPELPAAIKGNTAEEKLMSALHFVQEDIRYLSLSLGENSHRPALPADVLSRRFGDCKDKTLLLLSLLRRMGMEAEPVLLSARQRKGLDQYLPSSSVFDHVIVRAHVAGKAYYLDPTAQGQGSQLDRLPPPWPDVDVLPVQAGSNKLVRTPKRPTPDLPMSERREIITVTAMDQPVTLVMESRYQDDHAEYARRFLSNMGSAQTRKAYESLLDQRYPQAQLLEGPKVKDDRAANEVTVRNVYRIPNFFDKQGNRWALRFEASNLVDALPLPGSGKRSQDVYLPASPWFGRYRLEVNLPEIFDARYTPDEATLNFTTFKVMQKATFSGRKLSVDANLRLDADRIPAGQVAQYLQDLRKVSPYLKGVLYVSEDDQARSAPELSLKETSRQRLEQVLKATAQAMTTAKANGSELAGPACEHALAAAFLNQPKVALQDADDGVNEQPAAVDPLACRGKVRLILGDMDGAIRDLNRAYSLGTTSPDARFYRGLALFYSGQRTKAAVDFGAYGAQVSDEHGRARARVWQWLAEGKTAAGDEQVWPAPVLAVAQGRQSAEDLLDKLMQRERGHRLSEHLAEAYFYLARLSMAQNPIKARAYLERSLELAPLYSPIRLAATQEMKLFQVAGPLPKTKADSRSGSLP